MGGKRRLMMIFAASCLLIERPCPDTDRIVQEILKFKERFHEGLLEGEQKCYGRGCVETPRLSHIFDECIPIFYGLLLYACTVRGLVSSYFSLSFLDPKS